MVDFVTPQLQFLPPLNTVQAEQSYASFHASTLPGHGALRAPDGTGDEPDSASLTPYALLADQIPETAASWDLEHVILIPAAQRHAGGDYTGLDLLRELGHHDPVFRDSHLLRIAERVGLPFATLQDAALELARENRT